MTDVRSLMAACIFASTGILPAQQQTGAPAAIPAPPVPAQRAVRPADRDTAPVSAVFRVRVVDGRTAAPVRNAHVKLWYDEPAGPGYELATDATGFGSMPAPVGDPVRVLATVTDYTDCRRPFRDDPPQGYSLDTIRRSGTAAQNTCGPVAVHTLPGELVLFVRPARWYEGLNRSTGN